MFHDDQAGSGRPPSSSPSENSDDQIERVSFDHPSVRPGRLILAHVVAPNADPRALQCRCDTPGFSVEMLPRVIKRNGNIVVGLRFARTPETTRNLCLVRFCIGQATAVASVTVVDS